MFKAAGLAVFGPPSPTHRGEEGGPPVPVDEEGFYERGGGVATPLYDSEEERAKEANQEPSEGSDGHNLAEVEPEVWYA